MGILIRSVPGSAVRHLVRILLGNRIGIVPGSIVKHSGQDSNRVSNRDCPQQRCRPSGKDSNEDSNKDAIRDCPMEVVRHSGKDSKGF